jgi:YD repeat-containing protein
MPTKESKQERLMGLARNPTVVWRESWFARVGLKRWTSLIAKMPKGATMASSRANRSIPSFLSRKRRKVQLVSCHSDLVQVTSADADGNLITETDIATGNTINYTWDYRNRLTEVIYKDSGGATTETIQYAYNALNQRISQTVTNASDEVTLEENYVYDGSSLLMVMDGSGNITHTFLNGVTGEALADIQPSGGGRK